MNDPRKKLDYNQLRKAQDIIAWMTLVPTVLIIIAMFVGAVYVAGIFGLLFIWVAPFFFMVILKFFGVIAHLIIHSIFSNADQIFIV